MANHHRIVQGRQIATLTQPFQQDLQPGSQNTRVNATTVGRYGTETTERQLP